LALLTTLSFLPYWSLRYIAAIAYALLLLTQGKASVNKLSQGNSWLPVPRLVEFLQVLAPAELSRPHP
jgi:hypothetical protein